MACPTMIANSFSPFPHLTHRSFTRIHRIHPAGWTTTIWKLNPGKTGLNLHPTSNLSPFLIFPFHSSPIRPLTNWSRTPWHAWYSNVPKLHASPPSCSLTSTGCLFTARIKFKTLVLAYQAVKGSAPAYIQTAHQTLHTCQDPLSAPLPPYVIWYHLNFLWVNSSCSLLEDSRRGEHRTFKVIKCHLAYLPSVIIQKLRGKLCQLFFLSNTPLFRYKFLINKLYVFNKVTDEDVYVLWKLFFNAIYLWNFEVKLMEMFVPTVIKIIKLASLVTCAREAICIDCD